MIDSNPYQAPSAFVEDVLPNDELVLAERGTRLGSAILDVLISGVLAGILAAITIPAFLGARHGGPAPSGLYIVLAIVMVLAILVPLVLNLVWWHKYGQSIGKRICKIRIVRTDGSRAGLGRIFWLRFCLPAVLGRIPFVGAIFSLVNVCLIFREDRRCVHDHMADTMVIIA